MAESNKSRAPAWATKPFHEFIDFHKRIHDFYHLSVAGFRVAIAGVARMTELLDQMKRLDQESNRPCSVADSDYPDESERERAARAQVELDQGLPTLHESQTILLWSSVEWLVEDFVVNLVAHKTEFLKLEPLRKIRISLAEYEALEGDEKYRYIFSELERDSKIGFKFGVDRFETILGHFGMSGAVDPEIRKGLLELENVRNVLVHRRGVADARLVRNCPWIGLRPGERVSVTEKSYRAYYAAVFDYVSALMDRVFHAGL